MASIAASVLIVLLQFFLDQDQYSALVFGASFIGMSSVKILRNKFYYAAAPVYTIIQMILSSYITNIGGLLGLSALISVIIVYYSQNILLKY